MLTIQPKFTTTFTARGRKELSQEEIERREYEKTRRELMEQKEDFVELAEDDDVKLPEFAKKAIKGGAIVTTGLLGGMAAGWGTKKSFQGLTKILKSKPVQNLKSQIKATKDFIKQSASTISDNFKKLDLYKVPAAAIEKNYNKFAATKFGKPVVSFFKAVGKGIKSVFKGLKNAYNYISKKITGVKKETYEKAAVNTVGISGGIASGVTALNEKKDNE